MDAYKTIEYKGKTIELYHDEIDESPREWDNLGTMVCFRSKYNLGDKHDIKEDYYYNENTGEEIYCNSWNDIKEQIEYKYGAIAIMLPLYLYDHSGITMYTTNDTGYRQHEAWDTSNVGFIFVTKNKLRKECQVKRITKKLLKKAEDMLLSEVKTYDTYLRGDIVGFNTDTDSCGGFYSEEDAIQEAKNSIDYQLEQEQKQKEARLKAYIINKVPYQYRFA